MTWAPKTWKGWVAYIVALFVFMSVLSYVLAQRTPDPKPPAPQGEVHLPDPAWCPDHAPCWVSTGTPQAQLMSVRYGLPHAAEKHCHWVYFVIFFQDCHLIIQERGVDALNEKLNEYGTTDAELTALGAALCAIVAFMMKNPVYALICGIVWELGKAHFKDVIKYTAAVNDACLDIHYYSGPFGPPYGGILPIGFDGMNSDGGWCYDGFYADQGYGRCEYYLTVVNGWDVYQLTKWQPSTCRIA